MAASAEFERWEREISDPVVLGDADYERFSAMPPSRHGKWHILERSLQIRQHEALTSLEYAQLVQRFAAMLPPADRLTELLSSQEYLEDVAFDVKGNRVYLRLEDGGVSCDVGGYGVYREGDPILGLRVYELNSGAARWGGMDSETGLRLADERFVPVLAVRSLAVLPRRTTRVLENEASRGIISPFRKT